jgi:hypothetical protein
MSPRAGLDTEARGKILCTCRGSNPGRPARSQTQETVVKGIYRKPHADKHKGIKNDSNYVASGTPTSPPVWDLMFRPLDFCCSVHGDWTWRYSSMHSPPQHLMVNRSSFTLRSAEEEQAMRNLLTLSGKEA